MTAITFPRTLKRGKSVEPFDDVVIEASLNLRQASLGDAALYGGPITRAALDAIELRGDRRYVVVDTKVNMLLPGMVPAIPGWHTDGVPREYASGNEGYHPAATGPPRLDVQAQAPEHGITEPRYHLMVTGTHAPTEFIDEAITLNLEHQQSDELYSEMTQQVNDRIKNRRTRAVTVEPWTWYQWSWWSIHRAVPATERGWRYLIRVTESDDIAPREGPSNFIRPQSQVYVEKEFGW